MERYRRRCGPYLALVSLGHLVAVYGFCALLALFLMYVSMIRCTLWPPCSSFSYPSSWGGTSSLRLARAWHSIKTGKAFT